MLEFLRRTDGTERRCLSINRSRYFATMSGVLKLVASNSNCGLQARLSYACTTGYRAPSTQTRKHSLPAHRTDIQHKNTEQTAGAVAARRYGMRWRWGPDRGWREVESGGDKQVAPPVPGSSHTRKRVEQRSHGRPAGDLRSCIHTRTSADLSDCARNVRNLPSPASALRFIGISRRTKTGHEWIWASRKVRTCH